MYKTETTAVVATVATLEVAYGAPNPPLPRPRPRPTVRFLAISPTIVILTQNVCWMKHRIGFGVNANKVSMVMDTFAVYPLAGWF